MKKLSVMSLFSGCGGLDYEFITDDNFELVGLSEIDKNASKVLQYRHPTVKNYGDIKEINPEELPEMDLVLGGFPCQDFSTQGNMEGLKGEKSSIFFEIPKILKDKKPKYVILENVKNLLSNQMRGDYQKIIKAIRECGYRTNTQTVDSSEYGTPQQRIRAIIFCIRKDIKQDRKNNSSDVLKRTVSVKGFEGLNPKCQYVAWSKSTRKEHTDNRIRFDDKIGTLTTGDGCKGASTGTMVIDNSNFLEKGTEVRNLTVNECEALMCWPKDFTRYGIDNSGEKVEIGQRARYNMCGNGVVSTIMKPYKNIIMKYEGLI